jgi:hypothetical protein
MMKQSKIYFYGLMGVLSYLPISTFADNAWGGYSSVERRPYQQAPTYQQPAQDPFAFSNQRYTPTAPQKAITINQIKIIIPIIQIIVLACVLNIILRLNMSIVIVESRLW